jgi:hypothetical protein
VSSFGYVSGCQYGFKRALQQSFNSRRPCSTMAAARPWKRLPVNLRYAGFISILRHYLNFFVPNVVSLIAEVYIISLPVRNPRQIISSLFTYKNVSAAFPRQRHSNQCICNNKNGVLLSFVDCNSISLTYINCSKHGWT